jgi:hypothetical protein
MFPVKGQPKQLTTKHGCTSTGKRRTVAPMALAVTPGRDPDETPTDRLLANIAAVALVIVAVAFVVWLVWVYVFS